MKRERAENEEEWRPRRKRARTRAKDICHHEAPQSNPTERVLTIWTRLGSVK